MDFEYMEKMRKKYFLIDHYTNRINALTVKLRRGLQITERVQSSQSFTQEDMMVEIIELKGQRSRLISEMVDWRGKIVGATSVMDKKEADLIRWRYIGRLPGDVRNYSEIKSWGQIADGLKLTGKGRRSSAKNRVRNAVESSTII